MTFVEIPAVLMTTEQLLALPEDGMDRDLIRGELRERPRTPRSRPHSRAEAKLAFYLVQWVDQQPEPRGEVLVGEACVRLRRNPDTTVGIDVVYFSADALRDTPDNAFLTEGPPVLAVEILSPGDKHEYIVEKVTSYLEAGVKLVWVVDPVLHTVAVYRPDAEPQMFSASQELSGEPHLPGFRVPVAALFAR